MSKASSGLYWGTKGSKSLRLVPGAAGIVTGGSSQKLGKNMLQAMGLSRKTKWTGYQAQHIIPVALRAHPVLKKMGFDLDDVSNGIFLREPNSAVSAISRHKGFHSTYNSFVKKKLDEINSNSSINSLQNDVKYLQTNLRKMLQSGIVIYPDQGASIDLLERTYNRITQKRGY
jgi:hypothetical protein